MAKQTTRRPGPGSTANKGTDMQDTKQAQEMFKQQEEVYVGESLQPLALDPTSPALHTLQRIRDEAHRFAITYHKKLRSKRTLQSVLDTIPGVGPTIRTSLLK